MCGRIEGKRPVIQGLLGFRALHHAAIDQQRALRGLKAKARAGHRPGRAVKGEEDLSHDLRLVPVRVSGQRFQKGTDRGGGFIGGLDGGEVPAGDEGKPRPRGAGGCGAQGVGRIEGVVGPGQH